MATSGEFHTVKSFDEELDRLSKLIVDMGVLAASQAGLATQALMRRDPQAAEEVILSDTKVDALEAQVEALVVRLLALRQPMAVDLRAIVCALKTASDLERIADYAKNNAKRAIALAQLTPPVGGRAIPGITRTVETMVHDVITAFSERDPEKALVVWRRDAEVDDAYTSLLRENLTYMMEDPRNITACTHILFIGKNLERMGDHATNIAENVYFLVKGERLGEGRPRGHDETAVTPGLDGDA